MRKVKPVPCAHIAAYYKRLWDLHPSLGNNILRCGYAGWARGEVYPHNNLYEASHD